MLDPRSRENLFPVRREDVCSLLTEDFRDLRIDKLDKSHGLHDRATLRAASASSRADAAKSAAVHYES